MATSFRRHIGIAPLVVFRMLFGLLLFASSLRFVLKGWVQDLYLEPNYFFSWLGLEWIQPLGPLTYLLFGLMALSAAAVVVGYRYRFAAVLLFLSFTYVELIDKSTYLNHYYFVSLVSFLMIWLPAHRSFSMDVAAGRVSKRSQVPLWTLGILRLQMGIVYFFAGLAKLNSSWLVDAMPLKIWLPAKIHLPLIGPLLAYEETAYLFSWAAALYDLSIPFLLLWSKSRPYAFAAVVAFHFLTALLFPIGVFPWVMIGCALVFFSAKQQGQWLESFKQLLPTDSMSPSTASLLKQSKLQVQDSLAAQSRLPAYDTLLPEILWKKKARRRLLPIFMALFFAVQAFLPMRHLLYPGNLFWTEQGYRFSWRVMLMEKAGAVWYRVHELDSEGNPAKEWLVYPADYLTPLQEKMMATQPDMILQFAHFLGKEFQQQGFEAIEIRAESYVSLNGEGSQVFIDPTVNLLEVKRNWRHKDWVLPFQSSKQLAIQ